MLPTERTTPGCLCSDTLLLWRYAADDYVRPLVWLGPQGEGQGSLIPVLRHWSTAEVVHTAPLPGIHFFDAWRISPNLRVPEGYAQLLLDEASCVDPPAQDSTQDLDQEDKQIKQQLLREQQLAAQETEITSAQRAAELGTIAQLVMTIEAHADEIAYVLQCLAEHQASQQQAKERKQESRSGQKRPNPNWEEARGSSHSWSNASWKATRGSSQARSPPNWDEAGASDQARVGTAATEGAPTVPSTLVDQVLPLLPRLPNTWPLARIDMLLHKGDGFYSAWRRFLHMNEYLRTWQQAPADATIEANAPRQAEHLVEILSEWLVAFLEPAKIVTERKAQDFLFLHDKNYWYKEIYLDLHQAVYMDRDHSRTRSPIGLVRCLNKDRGQGIQDRREPVKIGISSLQVFVPIWMMPPIVRQLRMMERNTPPVRTAGHISYKEGWFQEGEANGSLSGIRLRISDMYLSQFNREGWQAIRHLAAEGLVKKELWDVRSHWFGTKVQVDIPLAGTVFVMKDGALMIQELPEGWPLSCESAWREHEAFKDSTLAHLIQHLDRHGFNKDVLIGGVGSPAFLWNNIVEAKWPYNRLAFDDLWVRGERAPKNAQRDRFIAGWEWGQLRDRMPRHATIVSIQSEYTRLLREAPRVDNAPPLSLMLEERKAHAATVSGYVQGLRSAVAEAFPAEEADLIMDQIICAPVETLSAYLEDVKLFVDAVKVIAREYDLHPRV